MKTTARAEILPFPPPRPARTGGRAFLRERLPGLVAGAADLDPAAVLTATVAGATFGLSIAWVVLICFPVLRSVFHVSARIGHESRKGLVELTREQFGKSAGFALAFGIVIVNFAMLIGDLVAISDSLSVIMDQSRLFFLAPIAFLVWYLLLLGDVQKIMKWMGVLALTLIAYVAAAYLSTPSTVALAKGIFLPHLQMNGAYAMGVIAVFGSLLTPDVIVWQTSSRREAPVGVVKSLHNESHAGTIVACLISLSAIVCASRMQIADPANMTTRAAADALNPLGIYGPLAFSIGILGSGLVALPLLVASLSFSVAEAFAWKSGLGQKPWEARHFFILISICLFLAAFIDFFHINTVKVLYWSQVMAGFLVVPILGLLLLLGNNPFIVRTRNTRGEKSWLWLAFVAMLLANGAFLISLLF